MDASGQKEVVHSQVVPVKLTMDQLSPEEIEAYLKTNEWVGVPVAISLKPRVNLFKEVQGESSAIVGLLTQLLAASWRLGIRLLEN